MSADTDADTQTIYTNAYTHRARDTQRHSFNITYWVYNAQAITENKFDSFNKRQNLNDALNRILFVNTIDIDNFNNPSNFITKD